MSAPAPRMLFVVGRGRSGTTLLARLLTQHSEIAVAPEGMFVSGLWRRHARGLPDPSATDRFVRDLFRERRLRTWHLDTHALRRRLRVGASYAEACRSVYASYAEDTLGRRSPRWLGDKNPHHALFAPELAALFPEARFVHVTRDPRDNVRSYLAVDFDLGDPVALAYRWRRYNELLLRAACGAPGRFLRLRYEDLVADPVRELRRVCAFLGLELEPALLAPALPGARLSRSVERGWYQTPLGPIDAGRARGEGALPPALRARVDAVCAELAPALGYAGRLAPGAQRARARPSLALALGAASVIAERGLLGAAPLALRSALINGYRRALGRI